MMDMLGEVVLFRTLGGPTSPYDLPALVTAVAGSLPDEHPAPHPEGATVHLTVFSPAGFGTVVGESGKVQPGTGTYVEWNVPMASTPSDPAPRTWRPLAYRM